MRSFSALTLGALATSIAAQPTTSTAAQVVRVGSVVDYLDRINHSVQWEALDNDTQIATFTADEWDAWEQALVTQDDSISTLDRRTSVTCYGRGVWITNHALSSFVGGVCAAFSYAVDEGSVQVIKRATRTEGGDDIKAYFKMVVKISSGASAVLCNDLLSELINEHCQGEKHDTQGGIIKDDAADFYADPGKGV